MGHGARKAVWAAEDDMFEMLCSENWDVADDEKRRVENGAEDAIREFVMKWFTEV